MVKYVCPRCHYTSKVKNDLRRHFKRKKPCKIAFENKTIDECISEILGECEVSNKTKIPNNKSHTPNVQEQSINSNLNPTQIHNSSSNIGQSDIYYNDDTFYCKFCNKEFPYKQNKYRHERECVDRLKDYISREEVAQKLAEKDILIEELRNQIGTLLEKVGDTYNTNTYNIVINPFGKENTNYITSDYVNNLISNGPINSIPQLIKYIHFHPEHKENHNVKIPNKKQPYAQIYNGTSWEYQSKKDTIEAMSDKAYTILNKHYIGGNEYMNTFQTEFEENCQELSKRLQQDIELTIINNQHNITK